MPLYHLPDKIAEVIRIYPWYSQLLGDKQEDAPLEKLPLLSAEVMERFYYTQPPADPSLAAYKTSGTSSGQRKTIYYSEEDDKRYVEIKTRLFGELIAGSGCTRALADMGTGHAASTALIIFEKLGLAGKSIAFELPVEQHIEQLLTFQPHLLYTMPSILDHIVHAAKDPRSFGIRKIILVGEVASPEWQRNMALIFGLEPQDITDTYGSIEIGTIAYYSHALGRYLFAEGIQAEAVRPEELGGTVEPLGEGESILALTSYVRQMLPAIRFVTYDVVRDFRTVQLDGVERQSFRAIVKRVGRELKHGEKISLYDIERVVYRHVQDGVIRVKVAENALTVSIRSKASVEEALPAIREGIRDSIPEIGLMIRNRLLDDILVVAADTSKPPAAGPVKGKKLYVEKGSTVTGASAVEKSAAMVEKTVAAETGAAAAEKGMTAAEKDETVLEHNGAAEGGAEAKAVAEEEAETRTAAVAEVAYGELTGGILGTIGHTPLVELDRLFAGSNLKVYAKLELLNPGGSAKDRPALRMIQEAWKAGRIGPGSVIIESSSGNMAISLAMICQYLGMPFISVIDPRTTDTNISMMKALGAKISYVSEPDPLTGEFLPARLNRVRQLLRDIPGSYWPNQYENPDNYLAHYHTTMGEIAAQLQRLDYLFVSVSTCGTIRGLAEYARDHQLGVKIVAVDAAGSAIFGGSKEQRRFPGLGAGIVPVFRRTELIDHIVHVSDWEMVAACRALAREESILAGASSGAVVAAVRRMEQRLPLGSVCTVIVHDKGERYLDTVYSDAWIQSQFGRKC
ncbi:MAG: hypothetical protein K0R57_1449 [Paenibacillaceae bacterium]|nr:hypothetical protein [Paenibacillaceae bacterium]